MRKKRVFFAFLFFTICHLLGHIIATVIKPNSGIRAWMDFGILEEQILIAF